MNSKGCGQSQGFVVLSSFIKVGSGLRRCCKRKKRRCSPGLSSVGAPEPNISRRKAICYRGFPYYGCEIPYLFSRCFGKELALGS
jgi:hypothetical protein